MTGTVLRWIRTADSPVPVAIRALRRRAAQMQAIRHSGSIPAYMDEVVSEAPAHGRHPAAEPTSEPLTSQQPRSNPRSRHLVAVSTYPVHPRHSGGQLRGWYLANALSENGTVDVTVVSLTTHVGRAGIHQLGPGVREVCIAIPASQTDRETRLRLVAGPTSITDIAAALMWTGIPEFKSTLQTALEDASAAILVQPYLGNAVRTLAPELPLVCDEHNDELSLKQTMIGATAGGTWLLEHVNAIERDAIKSSALVTTTTESDLDTLDRRYGLPAATAVVPNGVDTTQVDFVIGAERLQRRQAICGLTGADIGTPTALFIGSGHRPNIDAGRAIISAARSVPEVDFLLAGRHSTALKRSRLPHNVHLLGQVSDDRLELLLSGVDIALNPMSAGSGSNLKLLTYLAAGIPVLSTDVGARGIDIDASGIFIMKSDDLAEGVRSVIGHNTHDRAIAGRHYVEEHCDWRAIGRRFASLVEEHALPTP